MHSAMRYSHKLLEDVLSKGCVAVDATAGNGHDTLFLSQKVGAIGHVFAFDIQEQAIRNTKERLQQSPYQNTTLFCQGHETLADCLPAELKIDAAIFNLGYLPCSDKTIITKAQTTLTALQYLLEHLSVGGRIVLVLYYGHEGGMAEKEAVMEMTRHLPQQYYQVLCYQFINQKNCPPICLCIEKIKELSK